MEVYETEQVPPAHCQATSLSKQIKVVACLHSPPRTLLFDPTFTDIKKAKEYADRKKTQYSRTKIKDFEFYLITNWSYLDDSRN